MVPARQWHFDGQLAVLVQLARRGGDDAAVPPATCDAFGVPGVPAAAAFHAGVPVAVAHHAVRNRRVRNRAAEVVVGADPGAQRIALDVVRFRELHADLELGLAVLVDAEHAEAPAPVVDRCGGDERIHVNAVRSERRLVAQLELAGARAERINLVVALVKVVALRVADQDLHAEALLDGELGAVLGAVDDLELHLLVRAVDRAVGRHVVPRLLAGPSVGLRVRKHAVALMDADHQRVRLHVPEHQQAVLVGLELAAPFLLDHAHGHAARGCAADAILREHDDLAAGGFHDHAVSVHRVRHGHRHETVRRLDDVEAALLGRNRHAAIVVAVLLDVPTHHPILDRLPLLARHALRRGRQGRLLGVDELEQVVERDPVRAKLHAVDVAHPELDPRVFALGERAVHAQPQVLVLDREHAMRGVAPVVGRPVFQDVPILRQRALRVLLPGEILGNEKPRLPEACALRVFLAELFEPRVRFVATPRIVRVQVAELEVHMFGVFAVRVLLQTGDKHAVRLAPVAAIHPRLRVLHHALFVGGDLVSSDRGERSEGHENQGEEGELTHHHECVSGFIRRGSRPRVRALAPTPPRIFALPRY